MAVVVRRLFFCFGTVLGRVGGVLMQGGASIIGTPKAHQTAFFAKIINFFVAE